MTNPQNSPEGGNPLYRPRQALMAVAHWLVEQTEHGFKAAVAGYEKDKAIRFIGRVGAGLAVTVLTNPACTSIETDSGLQEEVIIDCGAANYPEDFTMVDGVGMVAPDSACSE